jgi:hypothetical protein
VAKKKSAKRSGSGSSSAKRAGNTKKTSRRKKAAKRELIDTGTDKRYVRRDARGKFNESDDVGRSLAQDRRSHAQTVAKPGQGDRGDRPAKKKSSHSSNGAARSSKASSHGSRSKSNSSTTTTDHEEIRSWAEERGGKPVSIEGTGRGKRAGVLRIDFPGGATDPPLEPISWEAFFEKFDQAKLAMVYQDESADGSPSYFCKFVNRKNTKARRK